VRANAAPAFINKTWSRCSVLQLCGAVPCRRPSMVWCGIIAATFGPLHPSTSPLVVSSFVRPPRSSPLLLLLLHATLSTKRTITTASSTHKMDSRLWPAPLSHVSLFCFQPSTTVNQALIEALYDFMLYSPSLQLNKRCHRCNNYSII